jgi:hypothetical protein
MEKEEQKQTSEKSSISAILIAFSAIQFRRI